MSQPVISVEHLSKRYRIGASQQKVTTFGQALRRVMGDPFQYLRTRLRRATEQEILWALKDVSFEVREGEVLGVIGRNGAGKSTLLKILSRITDPTEGRAVIRGRVNSLLEVGVGFHRELTGRENIYLNAALHGMKRAEIKRKLDEIVAFAEVGKFLDTPVKFYSSGMYTRLAFAVAAHLDPEILLVDEVLAVGDAPFQEKCLGKMRDIASAGPAVLFVSHNMSAIRRLCSRCILLVSGRVEVDGSPEKAVQTYLDMYRKPFLPYADLTNDPGRAPGYEKLLKGLHILDADGRNPVSGLKTGEGVTFEIQYDCLNYRCDYAVVGIVNSVGERVLTVASDHCSSFCGVMRGQGKVQCRIPALMLAGGMYTVTVAIGTRNPFRVLDCVENAIQFRIEFDDFFGTGISLLPGFGYWVQPSQWTICD